MVLSTVDEERRAHVDWAAAVRTRDAVGGGRRPCNARWQPNRRSPETKHHRSLRLAAFRNLVNAYTVPGFYALGSSPRFVPFQIRFKFEVF